MHGYKKHERTVSCRFLSHSVSRKGFANDTPTQPTISNAKNIFENILKTTDVIEDRATSLTVWNYVKLK